MRKKPKRDFLHGVLNIDKPPHCSSHDVVTQIRALGCRKVGHAGTLDPLATGVLPICIGQATKIIPFLQETRKTYVARMRLGIRTDTQDATGRIIATAPLRGIREDDVRRVCEKFIGVRQQVPPMYSAVKYQGKPLYHFARQGLELPRSPRTITIFSLELLGWTGEEVLLRVVCSSGTYIRTLCDEIGEHLGCWAHVTQLVRTAFGPFLLRHALSLSTLHRLWTRGEITSSLYSLDQALSFLPVIVVTPSMAQQVGHGVPVSAGAILAGGEGLERGKRFRLHAPDHTLLAIGEALYGREEWPSLPPHQTVLRLVRVFSAPQPGK